MSISIYLYFSIRVYVYICIMQPEEPPRKPRCDARVTLIRSRGPQVRRRSQEAAEAPYASGASPPRWRWRQRGPGCGERATEGITHAAADGTPDTEGRGWRRRPCIVIDNLFQPRSRAHAGLGPAPGPCPLPLPPALPPAPGPRHPPPPSLASCPRCPCTCLLCLDATCMPTLQAKRKGEEEKREKIRIHLVLCVEEMNVWMDGLRN